MPVTPNSLVSTQGVRALSAVATAAKTVLSDNTNAVTLVPSSTNGALVTEVSAIARASNAATQLQLFIVTGSTYQLWDTVVMPTYAMSTATAQGKILFDKISQDTPLKLGANQSLACGIGVALSGGIVFTAQVEDF